MDGNLYRDSARIPFDQGGPGHELIEPDLQTLPVVVASPHSGSIYPTAFVAASRLDPITLRRSEDSFVDELFAGVVSEGVPLLRALFPRAYVDVNREPFELDPRMFADVLPAFVTTRSPRVNAGLGTIARIVANGQEIYGGKLRFAEVYDRINRLYRPYHNVLAQRIAETRERFGHCLLIDAHSMPSTGVFTDWGRSARQVEFVLGDCHGRACNPRLMEAAEQALTAMGYGVVCNEPYPGGFTTRHYGRPGERVHALQIEVNRGLYMDETTFTRRRHLAVLEEQLTGLVAMLGRIPLEDIEAA